MTHAKKKKAELVEEVAEAFGDCENSPFDHHQRQLHFITSDWFDADDKKLETALKTIGVYDFAFRPEAVIDWIHDMTEEHDWFADCKIAVAREYKPTLYVEVEDAEKLLNTDPPGASEFAQKEHSYMHSLTIRRENEITGEKMETIVPRSECAKPNPEKEVVRICWT